ncbi:rhomboid family domain-containing protein [Purpureocillium lilacinum]|uniref:Rhomboid family domain-containing protein n=1 Tax=Purpureocillium lilacinum TaxID=33203 RepID=A0A179GMF3_PURLI|nr:rhomboid family domain-containing protein [Purpureocillium lilacinum]OAQ79085.1 rhomboid family domain-containing protein [Purpureocillium lilacinum]OAQ93160.1 rhomboid family domain-containing protein [Purpureocillium lilacinum]
MTRLDLAAFRTHTHSKAASCRRLRRHESPVHGTAVQFHSTNDACDSGLQRPSGSVLCPTTPAVHQGNRRHYFIFLAVEPPFDMGCEQLGAYRLSTFPLVHLNLIHAALNVIALTPLMERFESEYGTLTTLALDYHSRDFISCHRSRHPSRKPRRYGMWVFLLLGAEAIRTYRSNPHLVIATYHIPTWTTPLLMIFVVAVLIPSTSLLGHLCGVGVGYLGKGWSRLYQVSRASRVGAALDRDATEPLGPTSALCERGPKDVWAVWGVAHDDPCRRQCGNGARR